MFEKESLPKNIDLGGLTLHNEGIVRVDAGESIEPFDFGMVKAYPDGIIEIDFNSDLNTTFDYGRIAVVNDQLTVRTQQPFDKDYQGPESRSFPEEPDTYNRAFRKSSIALCSGPFHIPSRILGDKVVLFRDGTLRINDMIFEMESEVNINFHGLTYMRKAGPGNFLIIQGVPSDLAPDGSMKLLFEYGLRLGRWSLWEDLNRDKTSHSIGEWISKNYPAIGSLLQLKRQYHVEKGPKI